MHRHTLEVRARLPRFLAVLAITGGLLFSVSSLAEASTYALQASTSSNRSSAVALSGASISGSVYIFLTPTSGITKTSFWLDNAAMSGTALHVEGSAPLDFVGTATDGSAKPWDTGAVAIGSHSITALVTTSTGSSSFTTSFFVGQGAPPAPSGTPSATPKPSATVTPGPSPTPKPSVSPSATPSPTPKPSATTAPTPTPTPKPSTTPAPAPTVTPAPTPTPTPAPTAASGFVGRSGTQLMLGGKPYVFTGFNIYQANSRSNCSYTMGTGSALDTALSGIGSGSEVFRAWFFQRLATTNGARDWSAFDHTLAVAKAHGVKIIATLGNQWGSCESPTSYTKFDSWYTGGYKTQILPENTVPYRQWVQEAVARYKNDPTIAMWQLMNEAEDKLDNTSTCAPAAHLYSFAADVSALVKSIDSNHLVSLGTMGSGQCATQGSDYQNLHSIGTIDVCEYHDYGHELEALPAKLAGDITACNALNKPIFVGEAGIQPPSVGGTFQARANAFDAKLKAQLPAGVRGFLIWSWNNSGSQISSWPVGPGDPTLSVINRY